MAAHLTQELGRAQARASPARAGFVLNEEGERVLSVRLHEKCDHKEEHWDRKKCGHCWCRMCNGFVHPGTRVSLKGPTDVVTCNRKWHQFGEYKYLFRENCAGSARLTQAMRRVLPKGKVAPAEDVSYDPTFDLLNDKVYERKKKEAKERDCFASHYAPTC